MKKQPCDLCGLEPKLPPVCGRDKNGYCAAFRLQAEIDSVEFNLTKPKNVNNLNKQ